MKTIKEWFETLPEPIRSKAFAELDEIDQHHERATLGLAMSFFDWSESDDGLHYWHKVFNAHDDLSQHPDVLAYNEPEKAMRHNEGKKNWSVLDCYFEAAQEAERICREYGIKKYTDETHDGLTNWMSSMGTEHHNDFMYGCLESANRHLLALRRGEQMDAESGCLHVGFVRLNMGMYQAYFDFEPATFPEVKTHSWGTSCKIQ